MWRVIQKHRLATGRVPVAIDFDEIGYLDTEPDPRVNAPAADNGRLGALKSAGYLELTDELRRRAASGESLLDKSLERLQFSAAADRRGPAAAGDELMPPIRPQAPAPTRGQAARAITTSLASPTGLRRPSVT